MVLSYALMETEIIMIRMLATSILIAALSIAPGGNQALAEASEVRIVQQFGLSYLPLHVAVEQKLIEKHARAAGLGDIKVALSRLASGAAVNGCADLRQRGRCNGGYNSADDGLGQDQGARRDQGHDGVL